MKRFTRWSLVASGPALVLVGAAVWWFSRGPGPAPVPRSNLLEEAATRAAKTDARAQEVLRLAREKGTGRQTKLVELYGRLAGDKSAVGVRSLALNALFGEESLPLRLKGVLEAVTADSTDAREDPLWPKIVEKLSEQWTPDVFDKGRDLMLAEQRSRAKRAIIDSFVELVRSERGDALTPEQSTALLTDLIDMHGTAAPDQKRPIEDAVRKLGGNDPADLLAGARPEDLELHKQEQKNLQAGVDALNNGKPLGN